MTRPGPVPPARPVNQQPVPMQVMLHILYRTVWTISLLVLATPAAWGTAVLEKVHQGEAGQRLQIFLRFDSVPDYRVVRSTRRIDIILEDTVIGEKFTLLPGDDRMVKMVSRRKDNSAVLSLYFRYKPQEVQVKKGRGSESLILDILTGNAFSSKYPDLSARLHGVSLLQRSEVDYTNPLQVSRWAGNWLLFFKEYETDIEIRPQLRFTLPPFPLAAELDDSPSRNGWPDWLPGDLQPRANSGEWTLLLSAVRELLPTEDDVRTRERLLLTYGELLVRSGGYEEPYELLQQIELTYPESRLSPLARFLFLYLQASREDPYLVFFELNKLEQTFSRGNLAPYFNIFQAETAIASGSLDRAEEILKRDEVAYTDQALFLRRLRQIDIAFLRNNKIRGLVGYLQLEKHYPRQINEFPASLAHFADALYTHRKFAEAAERYRTLSGLLTGTSWQDLSRFRLIMARMRNGEEVRAIRPLLDQLQEAFPGTRGAWLAHMKQTDLEYLAGRLSPAAAASRYHEVSENMTSRETREEALFKEALVQGLAGNHGECVDLCMTQLREFRTGKLKTETRALLLQHLTPLIRQLIDSEQYIRALVLAKQNRFFFTRGWVKTDLLYDLAKAYQRLGSYERAIRTYQYIMDVSPDQKREQVYLPLLESLYRDGRYELLEDYADRYAFRYPDGKDREKIFLLRLKGLRRSGQPDRAAGLLAAPDHPDSPAIRLEAAAIHFDLQQWEDVAAILTDPAMESRLGDPANRYMAAESLFQAGRMDEAEQYFLPLEAGGPYRDQAMFRLAQIYLRKGKKDKALNQFGKLADKEKDSLWRKLAREELKILQLERDRS